MKILQVVATLAPRYGGPSFACPELSRELVRQGHAVSIYTSDVDGPGRLKVQVDRPVNSEGVEIHYFRGWNLAGKYVVSLQLWRALRATVAQFDVVQIWSVYSFYTTAAAHWCRKSDVPYVVFPHGSLDPYLRRRNRPRKWLYTKLLAERDYQKAAAVMFTCAEEMRLASDWPGLKTPSGDSGETSRQIVAYTGIGAEWLQEPNAAAGVRLRNKFPALKGRRLIVYLGRINFKKGLDILARAFARIARDREDLHLVVAGADDDGFGREVRTLARRGWRPA